MDAGSMRTEAGIHLTREAIGQVMDLAGGIQTTAGIQQINGCGSTVAAITSKLPDIWQLIK